MLFFFSVLSRFSSLFYRPFQNRPGATFPLILFQFNGVSFIVSFHSFIHQNVWSQFIVCTSMSNSIYVKGGIKFSRCAGSGKHFNFSVSIDGINDPEYVETFRSLWNEFIKCGLSIVAFVENPDGGKPIIAGANILTLSFKDEKFDIEKIKVIVTHFLRSIRMSNVNICICFFDGALNVNVK